MATTISVYYPPNITVGVDTVPFIVFSGPVQSGSIVFAIKDTANNLVNTTPSYNSGIYTYTLVPNQSLNYNTAYSGFFSSGLDIAGSSIAPFSWPFFTNLRMNTAGYMGWGASC